MNLPNLKGRVIACDFETTSLEWWKPDFEAFGVGLAWREGPEVRRLYLDLRIRNHRSWMEYALLDAKLWVNHYIKFDAHVARESGFRFRRDRLSCTMIREALCDENKYEYGLNNLSLKYLNRTKEDIWPKLAEMFGGKPTKEAQAKNLQHAPEKMIAPYAETDAELALLVHEAQDKIIKDEQLERVYALEMALLPVVLDMEHRGVGVDLDRAERNYKKLDRMVHDSQRLLDRMVGKPVNANSPVQVKAIVGVHRKADGYWYTKCGLKLETNPVSVTEKKKALEEGRDPVGTPSLDSVKLQQCKVPEADLIVKIRGYMKARDTFIKTYMLEMSHEGYLHASINQTRTEDGNGIYTGRLSISEPALQQIHKRNKEMAAIVRACFIPDEGDEWGCFDWSQMDFRLFASFLNDMRINALYAKDPLTDFHRVTADLTGLPRDRDQKTGGANAKQINLACVFGMGAGELAKQCNLPYTVSQRGYLVAGPEAKAMFAKYHNNIPGVKKLQNSVEAVAKSRGYIITQLGRRLRFPHGHGAHKAAGLLYQATAADAMKVKMIELHAMLENEIDCPSRLMLTVHDEFNVSMLKGYSTQVRKLDKDIQQLLQRFDGDKTPMKFRIPIVSDYAVGPDWHEASK